MIQIFSTKNVELFHNMAVHRHRHNLNIWSVPDPWAVSLAYDRGLLVGARALVEPSRDRVKEDFFRAGLRFADRFFDLESGLSYVLPAYRRLGVSSRQLGKLLAMADAAGKGVYARTLVDNVPAHGLLERHGFDRAGFTFWEPDGRTHLWLRWPPKQGEK